MVFKRISDIFKATIHEGLDQIENPLVMINQYLREMETEIEKARQAISRHMILQQSFQTQMEEARQRADKRKNQAQLAVDAGEEDLARRALMEKKQYTARTEHYRNMYENATEQVEILKSQLQELLQKYEEMRDRKYALIARANAAKTKEKMSNTMNRFHAESTVKEFERMEERIREMEVRAHVARSNNFSGPVNDPLDSAFAHLEKDEEIEQELAQLRNRKERGQENTAEIS